jgi:hypothetical protein
MKARNSSLALVPGELRVDCTGFQGGKQIQCPVMFVGTLEPAKDFAMVGLTYPVARSHAGRLDCSSTDITSAGLGGFKYRLTISAANARRPSSTMCQPMRSLQPSKILTPHRQV